jgi:hypothetical protein
MPTWKRVDPDGQSHFQHLCSDCSGRKEETLFAGGWQLIRNTEPVSCRDCVLKCRLTAAGLWGEADPVRYAVCGDCPEYRACELKGRYFC